MIPFMNKQEILQTYVCKNTVYRIFLGTYIIIYVLFDVWKFSSLYGNNSQNSGHHLKTFDHLGMLRQQIRRLIKKIRITQCPE